MRSMPGNAGATSRLLAATSVLLAGVLLSAPAPPASAAPTAVAAATSPAALFVTAAFHDLLDRPPSTSSRSLWTGRIASGAWSRKAFVHYLATSTAGLDAQVERAYVSILDRPPTPAAQASWEQQLASHRLTQAGLEKKFFGSDEYFRRIGQSSSSRWALSLYTRMLPGVVPTSAQVGHWVAVAAAHGRPEAAAEFYDSGGAAAARIKALYRRLLHRSPTPAALPGWLALARSRGDAAVAEGLASSAEYVRLAATRADPSFTPTSPFAETVYIGQPNAPLGLSVAGGIGPLGLRAFGVPAGMQIDGGSTDPSTGIATYSLHGTPTRTGSSTVTLVIADYYGSLAVTTGVVKAAVNPSPPPLRITSALDLGSATSSGPAYAFTAGVLQSDTIQVSGGRAPYKASISVTDQADLPAGISYTADAGTGTLGGTATAQGVFRVPVTATDANGAHVTTTVSVLVYDDVASAPLTNVTKLAGGCAAANGDLYCWGDPSAGANRVAKTLLPTRVAGLSGVTLVVHSGRADLGTCAVANGGNLYCGIGGGPDVGTQLALTPTQVPGLSGVTAVAHNGSSLCAIANGGTVSCWGPNLSGELGNGTTDPSTTPVAVAGLSGVTSVAAASESATAGLGYCAVANGGNVYCWGANDHGQVGNGSTTDALSPVQVSGVANATSLVDANGTTCAVADPSASLWCWGANGHGQVGNGSTTDALGPVQEAGLSGVTSVRLSATGTACALAGSQLFCWGANASGQVGNGSTTDVLAPFQVPGPTTVTSFATSGTGGCAVGDGGNLWCWGSVYLAGGPIGSTPTQVTALTDATRVWVGVDTCAAEASGALSCFGLNASGGVGTGDMLPVDAPTAVAGVTNVVALDNATPSTCALTSGADLWCWGDDRFDQLGDGRSGAVTLDPGPFHV
jgi:alpha-tubulin suppressor-like RCC1 family protein